MSAPRPQHLSKPKRFDRNVDGILLLDKPPGMSSNAALQLVRVMYRALKAGHAGSLDPLATGMLPLCFGQATKVCGYLLNSRKSYRVGAKLGIKTDSADADGAVIEECAVPLFERSQAQAVLSSFRGEQQQVPPMYSALKHEGQRLYQLARAGQTIERAAREIFIEHIELLDATATTIEFVVRCSKGTYVRSLVENIAERLGTVAHVTMLRRMQIDPFDSSRMVTLEALASLKGEDPTVVPAALDALLLTADSALRDLPRLQLNAEQAGNLRHGRRLTEVAGSEVGLLRAYDPTERFLGIVKANGQGEVAPERLFS